MHRMGQCPLTGAGAANCGGTTAGSCPRGSLPIGVAPNTEDSARDDRAGRQRPHGLTDALFRSGQRPLFSVPCGAVRGADNWANSCPRCSERSGNSCDCDSTIDCVASAEQVLASLARACSRHMSRDRSTAATWLRNRLQSFWSLRYLAQLIAACQQRSHQDPVWSLRVLGMLQNR